MEKRRILFFGDSNTYGYDPADYTGDGRYAPMQRWTNLLAERLGETWEVIPEGMNGRRLPERAYDWERLEKLLGRLEDRDVFSVMLGTNDLLTGLRPEASGPVKKLGELLDFLSSRKSRDTILIIAPPWIGGEEVRDPWLVRCREENRRMNQGFRLLCDQAGVHFADAGDWGIGLAYDSVHFSAKGHQQFAAAMAEEMKKL